ncbi:hypothetical protein Ana3638_03585 [Anaerocolumna sedimenticola]|uniref:BIG2 domain-containing protein n=1 Tax=Anaerocolumna sedimenticola TaxID=2696063 RepID=A0A6P1TK06_9FIRM|nr:Ig-like domain-containing protein [Anaerocolumna sedimenticola]QHQ59975.1 hypothetical protein Ana3638_03585 [Anaerocolumna sedimenticola]
MKRKYSRITAYIVMLVMIIAGISMNTGIVSAKESAKINLSKTSVTITAGASTTLKAKDQNGKAVAVKWTSSNTYIAKVSTKGVVTAFNKGSVTITATGKIQGKEYKAVCTVKVNPSVKVSSITMKKAQEMIIGDKIWAEEVVLPKNAANKTLKFTTSNKKVVSVSALGEIKAVAPGTATITAAAMDGSKKSAKMKVTVLNNLSLTSKDVIDGKITVSGQVYGNVSIDNSVGEAQINFNKLRIAGTLNLENNAGYALNLNECDIKNVNVKDLSKQPQTRLSYGLSLADEIKIPVINVTGNTKINIIITETSIKIIQGDGSEVQEIKLDAKDTGNISLSLEGYKGALFVSAASNAKVDINMKACEITSLSAQGTTGQSLALNDAGTTEAEKSTVGSLTVTGQLAAVVNVTAATLNIDAASNGASVTCNKPVTTINNAGQGSSIIVTSTVGNIVSTGNNTTVHVTDSGTVGTVLSQGNQSTITGDGTVTNVKIEGNNNSVDVPGATVEVGDNSNGTVVDGKDVEPGGTHEIPQPSNPSSGGGGGGGSGSKTVKETVYASDAKSGPATVKVEGVTITINNLANIFKFEVEPINFDFPYPKDNYIIVVKAVNGEGYNPIQIKNKDGSAATSVYYIKVDSDAGTVTVKGNTTSRITVRIGGKRIEPTKVYE